MVPTVVGAACALMAVAETAQVARFVRTALPRHPALSALSAERAGPRRRDETAAEDVPAQRPAIAAETDRPPPVGAVRTLRTRVVRGDRGGLAPPLVGAWTPEDTVSVVIPAYNCQAVLNLALAALRHQSAPVRTARSDRGRRRLLPPALRLPKLRNRTGAG